MRRDVKTSMLWAYSALAIPLAFAGLPIYVHIPHYYSTAHGIDLVTVSIVLLLVRFVDAFQDPVIGWLSDKTTIPRRKIMAIAAIPLMLAFIGLFHVPILSDWGKAVWMFTMLLIVYTSFSTLMINFYAAGLSLSQDCHTRTRISAFREGMMLVGVMIAAVLPTFLTERYDDVTAYHYFTYCFIPICLLCAFSTYRSLSGEARLGTPSLEQRGFRQQFALLQDKSIRLVLLLFFINSLPTAITSTLFLFYTEDVLGAKEEAGYMLLGFFAAAALSVAFWSVAARWCGKLPLLMVAMGLNVVSFIWAYGLGEGDSASFYVICVLTGIALGGEMTMLPSIFADVLGKRIEHGGVGFSLWHFLNKLNLSLAAGIVLPLLAWFGYQPAQSEPTALQIVSVAYALIPCLLKLLSLALAIFIYKSNVLISARDV